MKLSLPAALASKFRPYRELAELLVPLTERPARVSIESPDALLHAANQELLIFGLCWGLKQRGMLEGWPDQYVGYLTDLQQRNEDRNRSFLEELARTCRQLNSIGVEPVLLKGINALAGAWYPNLGIRFQSDMDVLVEADKAEAVQAFLLGQGFRACSPGAEYSADSHHQPRIALPGSLATWEVHRRPLSKRARSVLNGEQLIRDAAALELPGGGRCRIPRAEHALAITLLHTEISDMNGIAEGFSMRRGLDVVWLLHKHPSVDLPEVRRLFVAAASEEAWHRCVSKLLFIYPNLARSPAAWDFQARPNYVQKVVARKVAGDANVPARLWLHMRSILSVSTVKARYGVNTGARLYFFYAVNLFRIMIRALSAPRWYRVIRAIRDKSVQRVAS